MSEANSKTTVAAEALDRLDLSGCAAAIADGSLTSEAITAAVLARIEARNSALGAMLHVDADGAISRARDIDARRQRGETLGPLGGVPLTIKDMISVVGMPLTAASRILSGYRPPYDATVVARLRAAGAVLVGKTNQDEFAMGSANETSAMGPARNPWAIDRVPGGSSGGSAVAVASGMGFGSLGTDTGGSIRLPASFCGVVGLKPTYGRVSRYGVVAYASSLDQVGPFGRSVADVARLLAVIAGRCDRDSTSADQPVADYHASLAQDVAGLRVGVPREYLADADGLDATIKKRIETTCELLADRGATIVQTRLPHTRQSIAAYYLIATAEASANLARYDGVRFGHRTSTGGALDGLYERSRGEGFGVEVKRRILLGTFALSSGYYDAWYDKACRVRRLIHDDFLAALQQCDVLIGPTSPVPPWKLGEMTDDPVATYLMDVFTTGANLAGLPALCVPLQPADDGLPVGLQLIGRHFDEATLLRVGHVCNRENGAHLLRPPAPEVVP